MLNGKFLNTTLVLTPSTPFASSSRNGAANCAQNGHWKSEKSTLATGSPAIVGVAAGTTSWPALASRATTSSAKNMKFLIRGSRRLLITATPAFSLVAPAPLSLPPLGGSVVACVAGVVVAHAGGHSRALNSSSTMRSFVPGG